MIDWVGSDKINPKFIDSMKKAGVEVHSYHPFHWWDPRTLGQLDHRTHRKLLIIDGKIGFTGGVGIADVWRGDADSPDHSRDTHYRVEGPIVAQLQAAFMDNWMKTTAKVLAGEGYFPQLTTAGPLYAQVFKSSAQGGSESMELMMLLSIGAASKNIRMETAYFIPDSVTRHYLINACHRGVKVEIIIPGPIIDQKIVTPASRATWGEMLKAGVVILEYQPTMFHCKQLVVDEMWTSIGSANLDNRSFGINDETNLNVLDANFAASEIRIFEQDKRHCKQVTYEAWRNRPLLEKIGEALVSLVSWEL